MLIVLEFRILLEIVIRFGAIVFFLNYQIYYEYFDFISGITQVFSHIYKFPAKVVRR